jgi:ABC-type phosphate transport system substrate-binding protein
MKASTFAKAGVSVSAVAALTLGLCGNAFAAGPTATEEDPTGIPAAATLVGVGSDTTQDVMYGIAKELNAGQATPVIASYTATGTGTITYRSGKVPTRPNGSGAGYNNLKDSIGVTAAGLANANDVDFARASGTQGTAATTAGTGVSTDIPFATDTMSFAVPANSPFLLTNGGTGLTVTDLYNIYSSTDKFIDTTDGSLETAAGANTVPINAFVPKPGSGSRQFFLGQLATQGGGIDLTANSSTKGDGLYVNAGTPTGTAAYVGAVGYNAAPVQEHEATVLTSAPSTVAAIAPFSGAKYIGYVDGKIADPDTGKTAGVDYKLVPFKSSVASAPAAGVLPYTGTGTSLVPNPDYITFAQKGTESASFKMTRPVYNIIATSVVTNPSSSPKAQLIHDTFVGSDSKVCKAAAIAEFGFLPVANCGATTLTFDAPSTATVSATSTEGVAGKSAAVTVTVASNGNGGGKVVLTADGKDYTGTIASGQTATTVTVPTAKAGSLAYTGVFTPALGGVAITQVPAGTITVKAAPVVTPPKVVKVNGTVKAVAPKVKHTKKAKVTVTVTAKGTVATGKVTIVVKKGKKTAVTVKGKVLAKGKVVVTLPKKLKKGSYKVFVSYTGDAKVNAVALKSVTTLKVK